MALLLVAAVAGVTWQDRLLAWLSPRAADAMVSGGLSDQLALTLAFRPDPEPARARFEIHLKNQTRSPLTLEVEPGLFHGCIVVTPKDGQPTKFRHRTFWGMMMSYTWGVPTQKLPAGAAVTWSLPLDQLCDDHERPLNTRLLDGAAVRATLDEVAVMPFLGPFVEGNAKQVSEPISVSFR